MLDYAAAEAVGHLVLAQHGGDALHIALRGHSEHDALLRCHQVLELLNERGNGAVEAKCRARVHRNLAERIVFVEHVDGAELIEIETGMRVEERLAGFRDEDRCLQAG